MTKYHIKNYKGNMVESLSKFQKKYPNTRIVEAVQDKETLEITTEATGNTVFLVYYDTKTLGDDWPEDAEVGIIGISGSKAGAENLKKDFLSKKGKEDEDGDFTYVSVKDSEIGIEQIQLEKFINLELM